MRRVTTITMRDHGLGLSTAKMSNFAINWGEDEILGLI